ncbi:hypothetical protein [Dapis sp. BLCC M172]|uniref:nSTAND1 domain-containing NTPase n=1 Tax=Dapis sp. BLCC M172 TaxID=2975281 RepID=UPI003CEE1E5E
MAAQNNEKASKTGIDNKGSLNNYGTLTGIGVQNNVVVNLNVYLEKDDVNCPYKGFSSFLPRDAEYFFGRDEFVKKLLTAIETNNFIPVLGKSKTGKSSVILAGLVPQLVKKAKNWLFTFFRPGEEPFYDLAQALVKLYIPDVNETELETEAKKLKSLLQNKTTSLSEIIDKIQEKNPKNRILIIADQFEQLYSLCTDGETRYKFINSLLETFQNSTEKSSLSTKLITAIGTNFLENAEFHKPLADVLEKDGITLEPMKSDQLREVIEKPTQKLGFKVEKKLLESLIKDVINFKKEQESLALLSFTLTKLWSQQNSKQFTYQVYQKISKYEKIVKAYSTAKKKRLEQKNFIKSVRKKNEITGVPIIYRILILLFLFFVGIPVILELLPMIFYDPYQIECKIKNKC